MAWADPLPGGGFRAGYRDSAGRKHYIKDANGKTVRYERKRDAKTAGNEKEAAARRQAAVDARAMPATITLGEWRDHLAEKRRRADTDTDTTDDYLFDRYIRPRWGSVPLNKIRRTGDQGYQQWIDDVLVPGVGMRKKPQPGYVHRIWAAFSWPVYAAIKEEILDTSPLTGVKLPTKPKRKAKKYMRPDHGTQLGEHLAPVYRDMVDFDLETGLRPNELCGLHANRIDRESGWLTVAEVYVARKKIIRPYPKDEDARMVPLTPKALEILDRNLKGRDLNTGCGLVHSDGSTCTSPIVFLVPRLRRPVNPDTYRAALTRAAKAAGVPALSPYAGRRGFGTRAAPGLDAFALAAIMGHEDVNQTFEYVQQTPEARNRLLVALQQPGDLRLVAGAAGATAGAEPESEPLPPTTDQEAKSTG